MGQGFPSQRLGINLSAGTGNAQTGTAVLSNSNGFTFGMFTSASSYIITLSGDGVRSISAGTTNATGSVIVFSNSNGFSFGINGGTLTIAGPTMHFFDNAKGLNSPILAQTATTGVNLSFQRISVPDQISATRMDLLGHIIVAGSQQGTI